MVAIAIGFAVYNAKSDSSEVEGEAKKLIARLPGYSQNQGYYDALLHRFHSEAFEASYTWGGRRRPARFDAENYLRVLVRAMAEQAHVDQRDDIAVLLGYRGGGGR